jgi:hypothetical protein
MLCCSVIPLFQSDGNLPPGVHSAEWPEVVARFGFNLHRRRLLSGLHRVLGKLAAAGCGTAYLDGSFVSEKQVPSDFDGAWDLYNVDLQQLHALEPSLFDFSNQRAAQKGKYFGELFPTDILEGSSGRTFLDFFQQDKDTGAAKGIVAIDLRTL